MMKRKLELPSNVVLLIRLLSFILTLFTAISISINQYSLASLTVLLASLYLIDKKRSRSSNSRQSTAVIDDDQLENPFRKIKKSFTLSQLPGDVIQRAKEDLFNFVTAQSLNQQSVYGDSLELFEPIKRNSNCLFARKSHLWGSKQFNTKLSLTENVDLYLPNFIMFCHFCTNMKLDGFLVHLPGDIYGKDLKIFATAFNQILSRMGECEPNGRNCMLDAVKNVAKPRWVFEFCSQTFFITTFVPIYPVNHSRYTFNVNECFILFQPEVSFANHNLPSDTPHTNWSQAKTVRDQIRIAFRNSNREYLIRSTVNYPMAFDMIRPLMSSSKSNDDKDDQEDSIIKWWTFNHE